jgi:hypothetical protein
MFGNTKKALEEAFNEKQTVSNPVEAVVMCFDCMIAEGYKRDKGCHTAVIRHCVGCDTAKPILPKRHWSK